MSNLEIERALTPELLDLMEHEKAIEQGLTDIGWQLERIRDMRKYLAAGYSAFEDYCKHRWGWRRDYVNKQIRASVAIREIEAHVDTNVSTPTKEGQVRPLTRPDLTHEEKAEAWIAAVDAAGGGQPTAAEVQAAVDVVKPKPESRPISMPTHPAPFSDAIIDAIAPYVAGFDRVLDPFAGVGGVHRLRGSAGVRETVGVELEPEWADKHEATRVGDARDVAVLFKGQLFDAIVTSPTYGNRLADHHNATDDSIRPTYKHTLGRDLTDGNTGAMQWGAAYRDLHSDVWAACVEVLRPGGLFVLNVKDHVRDGERQHVPAWHVDNLCRVLGLELIAEHEIQTRGRPNGQNADVRVPFERLFVFRNIH